MLFVFLLLPLYVCVYMYNVFFVCGSCCWESYQYQWSAVNWSTTHWVKMMQRAATIAEIANALQIFTTFQITILHFILIFRLFKIGNERVCTHRWTLKPRWTHRGCKSDFNSKAQQQSWISLLYAHSYAKLSIKIRLAHQSHRQTTNIFTRVFQFKF